MSGTEGRRRACGGPLRSPDPVTFPPTQPPLPPSPPVDGAAPRWRSPWRRLAEAWRAEFGLYSALDRDSAEMRARHLDSVQRVLPLMVLANLANAALLTWALEASLPLAQRLPWLLALDATLAAIDAIPAGRSGAA